MSANGAKRTFASVITYLPSLQRDVNYARSHFTVYCAASGPFCWFIELSKMFKSSTPSSIS